jgi:hypothetical protein
MATSLGVSDDTLKVIKRFLYHDYLGKVLDAYAAFSTAGMLLVVNGKVERLFPVISLFVADHPEAQLLCLCYEGCNAQKPCRLCHTLRANLHQWDMWGAPRNALDTKTKVTGLLKDLEKRREHNTGKTVKQVRDKAKEDSVHLQVVSGTGQVLEA